MYFLIPENLPTTGMHLIEASAGTGKTFTVSLIYLQLLMGVRGCQPLSPRQILVVTFTEAATQELKSRIYNQLTHCLEILEQATSTLTEQYQLLKGLSVEDRAQVRKRLERAQAEFDQAAIYTIHGFCYQILKYAPLATQHHYHGGEMVEDDEVYYKIAIEDWWRKEVVTAPPEISALILSHWKNPEALQRQLHGLHRYAQVSCYPPAEMSWKKAVESCRAARKKLCKLWGAYRSSLPHLLENWQLNKRLYALHHFQRWCASIDDWSKQETCLLPPSALERFRIERLEAASGSLSTTSMDPDKILFETVSSYLDRINSLPATILYDALQSSRLQVEASKQEDRVLHFDDLVLPLAALLRKHPSHYLKTYLLKSYPAALIDEFQDTDAYQYQLFQALYQKSPDTLLIFIGDPKQAIYRFRGADLAIYAQAKRSVDHTICLTTNWRASCELIGAINALFSTHPAPFLNPQVIPFIPIQAGSSKGSKQLIKDHEPVPPFQLHYAESPFDSNAHFIERMSDWCASAIAQLLQDIASKKIWLSTNQTRRLLAAEDIVILVRQGDEASAVQKALASKGVASTYLSGKQSVFEMPVARRLYDWMSAVQQPNREDRLRRVLCSSWFKYTGVELSQISSETYDDWSRRLARYKARWNQLGPLGMIRMSLLETGVMTQLLQSRQGERELTDLMHLAELLQLNYEPGAPSKILLDWLKKQIASPVKGGIKGEQRRLERADQLIRITTIHKSKGLEFPVVFIPFACRPKQTKKQKMTYSVQGEHAIIHWDATEELYRLEQREQLAEELRLFYVALTRAVYACYLSLGEVACKGRATAQHHALSYLCQTDPSAQKSFSSKNALQWLRTILPLESTRLVSISPKRNTMLPEHADARAAIRNHNTANDSSYYRCSSFQRQVIQRWRLTSYTQLLSKENEPTNGMFINTPENKIVQPSAHSADQTVASPAFSEAFATIHNFPKGAQAGVFLHSLLEETDFSTGPCAAELKRRLDRAGYESVWSNVLLEWCKALLTTVFPGSTCQLCKLQKGSYRQEFEFTMRLSSELQAAPLQALLEKHSPVAHIGPKLIFQTVQGFLKGFIDLVFFYKEKYFIIDYKSNWLGDTASAYDQKALELAMGMHRYDLQYLIYTLALHQYLRGCDEHYDYQTHFGGVYYLFLRGIDSNYPCNGFFFDRPPKSCIEALEKLFMPTAFSFWQETSYGQYSKFKKQCPNSIPDRRTTGNTSA